MVLSMTLAALLLTGGLNAQEHIGVQEKPGGLFGYLGLFSNEAWEEEEVEGLMNRDGLFLNTNRGTIGAGSLTPESPDAPLGSSLLMLTATGIGYALLKKKEEKK